DTTGHHRESAAPHDCHAVEGLDDTDDGPEETDEGRARRDGAENPERSLQLLHLLEATLGPEIGELLRVQSAALADELGENATGWHTPRRLDTLQRGGSLALREVGVQPARQLGGLPDETAEAPQALGNDGQAHDRHEDERIGGEPALLN